jgi:hypothetical protein
LARHERTWELDENELLVGRRLGIAPMATRSELALLDCVARCDGTPRLRRSHASARKLWALYTIISDG